MKHLSVILLIPALCGILPADETNFDTAPDSSWTQFNPTNQAGFDFSGSAARLTCGVMPQNELEALYFQYGESVIFPRAILFAPTEYADVCVSVDLVAWNPTTNRSVDGQYHAVFTRIQDIDMSANPSYPGMASVSGYGMAVLQTSADRADLEFNVIISEFPIELGKVSFEFEQNTTYRLVLSSRGNVHTSRVFDLANPANPVAELQVIDDLYGDDLSSGRTGFGVVMDRLVPLDATFDNFLTWDAKPCPVAIESGTTPGTLVLTSDLYRAMGTNLETATDLSGPWQPAVPISSETAGGQLRLVFAKDQPRRFFRRRNL